MRLSEGYSAMFHKIIRKAVKMENVLSKVADPLPETF